jgi:hypothetical protein
MRIVAAVRMKSCPRSKIKGEGGDTSAGEIEITRAMLTAVPPTQSAEQGETENRESARARDKRIGKHTIFCLPWTSDGGLNRNLFILSACVGENKDRYE